ncbi:MAG: hypothetical protein SOX77_01275 [Candidatus Borkfalkiaceae bacterium]|nr:hypothetical protein [Christensenellaceae bacterium]
MDNALKIRELERRIKSLELKNAQTNFNYVRFQSRGQNAPKQTFAYNFKTLKKCVLKLFLTVYAQYAPGDIGYVKINGVTYKTFLPKNGKTEIACFVPFDKGVQTVSVYLSGEEEFTVDNCEFETFGCVDYPENDSDLSVYNEQERSVILFSHDKKADLIEYTGGELNKKAVYENVTAAAFFAYDGGYVVALSDLNGKLTARFLLNDFTEQSSVTLIEKGVISVCAFGGTNACFYAVKGNKVVKLGFDKASKTFTLSVTNYRAKKVTSNPAVEGYLILTEFDGNNKLVSLAGE